MRAVAVPARFGGLARVPCLRFVFPDPDAPRDHLMPSHRGVRHGQDGPPAVPDRADRRPHHDPAAPVGQRHRPGSGDPGAGGTGLAFPLPGVEHNGAVAVLPDRPVSRA